MYVLNARAHKHYSGYNCKTLDIGVKSFYSNLGTFLMH